MADQKKKRGCGGCLGLLLIVVALVGAFFFKVPQKLGLVKSAGARFTDLTQERLSASEIVAEAEKKGFKSEQVGVYVFPQPDSGDAVVFASYDFSKKGTALSHLNTYGPVASALVLLGGGEMAKHNQITHVGIEFRDEDGKHVMDVAATTSDIRELQEGKINEQTFIKERLTKIADYPNYVRRAFLPF